MLSVHALTVSSVSSFPPFPSYFARWLEHLQECRRANQVSSTSDHRNPDRYGGEGRTDCPPVHGWAIVSDKGVFTGADGNKRKCSPLPTCFVLSMWTTAPAGIRRRGPYSNISRVCPERNSVKPVFHRDNESATSCIGEVCAGGARIH